MGREGPEGKEGRIGPTGRDGRKGPQGERYVAFAVIGFLMLALLTLLIAAFVTIGKVNDQQDDLKHNTTQTNHALVVTQIDNCRHDHDFRAQNKNRAIAEKKLLVLFVTLAQQQIKSGKAQNPKVSQQFIKTFGPLVHTIRVLPVPDCLRVAHRLNKAIPPDLRVEEETLRNHALGRN